MGEEEPGRLTLYDTRVAGGRFADAAASTTVTVTLEGIAIDIAVADLLP